MKEDRLQFAQENAVRVMRFRLPFNMDTMEIDELMGAVMAGLEQASQEKWMVDLSGVDYMGSSMLGLMVNIRQRIRQGGGKLVLFGLTPQLLHTFKSCSLERLFSFAKTGPEAAAVLARL
jgi:anti-anti-sigma factor